MRKFWKPAILLLALGTSYGLVKSKLDSRMIERKSKIDIRYLPSPRFVQSASFGFKPAFADLFWIEALNYYGWQLTNKNRTFEYMSAYLELILALDPAFTLFYEWAATVCIYNALPITPESVRQSQRYVEAGIQNLAKFGIYNGNIITKGAFNFALELKDYASSIPYFEMAARIFPDNRDLFLVASSYATQAGLDDKALELKLEYLGFLSFEAQTKQELIYPIQVLTSSRFNKDFSNMIRSFRTKMEKDEDVKKLIEMRLADNPIIRENKESGDIITQDPRLDRILKVDLNQNWLPPDFHLLLTF